MPGGITAYCDSFGIVTVPEVASTSDPGGQVHATVPSGFAWTSGGRTADWYSFGTVIEPSPNSVPGGATNVTAPSGPTATFGGRTWYVWSGGMTQVPVAGSYVAPGGGVTVTDPSGLHEAPSGITIAEYSCGIVNVLELASNVVPSGIAHVTVPSTGLTVMFGGSTAPASAGGRTTMGGGGGAPGGTSGGGGNSVPGGIVQVHVPAFGSKDIGTVAYVSPKVSGGLTHMGAGGRCSHIHRDRIRGRRRGRFSRRHIQGRRRRRRRVTLDVSGRHQFPGPGVLANHRRAFRRHREFAGIGFIGTARRNFAGAGPVRIHRDFRRHHHRRVLVGNGAGPGVRIHRPCGVPGHRIGHRAGTGVRVELHDRRDIARRGQRSSRRNRLASGDGRSEE